MYGGGRVTIERQNESNQTYEPNWRRFMDLVHTTTSFVWDFVQAFWRETRREKRMSRVRMLERCFERSAGVEELKKRLEGMM